MSLYFESADILDNLNVHRGSLKSRIYNNPSLKSPAAQLYALVSETVKWNPELNEVIERSGLLKQERKLTPALSLVLVHDLLLAKRGIAAPSNHPLVLAIKKHKARLSAEFTKLRLKNGYATIEAFKKHIAARKFPGNGNADENDSNESNESNDTPDVRWIRINALLTTLEDQMRTTFADMKVRRHLADMPRPPQPEPQAERLLVVDEHVPDIIAIPRNFNITEMSAYQNGEIILQDKASCFPALLLDVASTTGDIIDACAAPGNKTTHLAALLHADGRQTGRKRRIWALERDKSRAHTLQKMITWAKATEEVYVQPGQDFLRLNPQDEKWENVEALLLDPSCSGSGMAGRDEEIKLVLPRKDVPPAIKPRNSRKTAKPQTKVAEPMKVSGASENNNDAAYQSDRLQALSAFQLKMLRHAFRFPSARRIVYSTCSVYAEENEHVVAHALESSEARENGWRLLRRAEQFPGMRDWQVRGDVTAIARVVEDPETAAGMADACIRCDKGGPQATIGFFVVGFVRDVLPRKGSEEIGDTAVNEEEEEWNGFEDEPDAE
ncbi:MAG: hypothetical protein M1823_003358 [Watsoniomyces obsoletus]|nr:MAG: hypothetical protein M1823_003358 [Watsoniomyces obsoletus]